jgi:DNA-binding response OmpR family regulator
VPVVAVLTAATATDAALARELGLSDCLAGPVAPQTLVDRVQACLGCGRATRVLRFGLELDVDSGILSRGASSVILGPAERRLLAALIEQSDRVLSRSQLQPRVGGARALNPGRVIDVSVCRLRRALRKLECGDILQTIRGRGYRLAARESRPRSAASGVGQASEDPERFFVRRGNAPVPFRDYIGVEQ